MRFSRKGALIGFIAGAIGGALAWFADFSFLKQIILTTISALFLALLLSFSWKR